MPFKKYHTQLFKISLLLCSLFNLSNAHSASLVARGVAVGGPLGEVSKPQLTLENIGLYFSEPHRTTHSANLMATIPVMMYSTKTRFIDNQFRFLVAPGFLLEKGPKVGRSWHYGTFTPLFLGGLVHPLAPGLGIAGYLGFMPPLRSGVANINDWVFVNCESLSYTANDFDITATMFYGHPGVNLAIHKKIRPNFLNFDFTATKKLSGIEVGPIMYSSQDLNFPVKQHQLAIGALVGTEIKGWIYQFWFGHAMFAYNFEKQPMDFYFRIKKNIAMD